MVSSAPRVVVYGVTVWMEVSLLEFTVVVRTFTTALSESECSLSSAMSLVIVFATAAIAASSAPISPGSGVRVMEEKRRY